MTLSKEQRVEHQIQTYMQHKLARDHAMEGMQFAKDEILEFFKNNEDSVVRVGFDSLFDIKAAYSEGSTKKLDYDQMAEDLKVERDVIKRDFLLKSIDDGKMSFDEFTSYYFHESNERLSIRLVKAEGK